DAQKRLGIVAAEDHGGADHFAHEFDLGDADIEAVWVPSASSYVRRPRGSMPISRNRFPGI
ncbi:MAG TPA: hypothetical protein VKU82_03705, partial [Planctomycetaceae bacterium]|nr:hypothetical protein [Planctomycetaceae bacterium]